jgi:hypothetical protein
MPEEEHIDLDYFADVNFDLPFADIVAVLERIDGTTEEYEAGGNTGTRRYVWAIAPEASEGDDWDEGGSEASEGDDREQFKDLSFVPVSEASPPAAAEHLIAEITVEYDLPDADTYAPPDTFVVRFTNDGYEMFTQEHYLRTAPTELFELLKSELEAGS